MRDFTASARAFVEGKQRIVFDARLIKRGKNKGRYEVFYRKGYRYVRTFVDPDAVTKWLCEGGA